MLSQQLWWYLFLGSVCGGGGGGGSQLALTSSCFERVDVEILVVRCNACPGVLRPLPDLVV